MRPNNPNRRLRHLKLLDPAAPSSSVEPSRAPSRPHRDHSLHQLLKAALVAPQDTSLWRAVFDAALRDGDIELSRRAARMLGSDGVVLEADVAMAEGKIAQAIVMVKDRPDIESRLRLAWALFYLGQRAAAAAAWMLVGRADEVELGRALSSFLKNRPVGEVETELKKLTDSESRHVAATASRLMAEIRAAAEDHQHAISWGRRAEWMMPYDASLKRLLARSYQATGNSDAAVARWKEVLALASEDAEAHEQLGNAARTRQDLDAAIEHYVQALAIDPFRGPLRVQLGDLASERGKEEEAIEHWETALRLDPKNSEALTRLAEHAWDRGDVPEALRYYLDLQKLGFAEDEEEEHLEMIGYLYSEVLLGGEDKRFTEAGAFFTAALKKFPGNPFIRIYEARRLIAKENFAEARVIIAAVLKQNPLMPEAVFEMGHLLIEDGKVKEGMDLLLRAETLDADPFYKKELGRQYLQVEDWPQAEKWLKKALSSGIEDEELFLALHTAAYYQGKYSMCENLLRRALAIFPDNMQALTYLAEILMLLGRGEDAMGILRTVEEMAITFEDYEAGNGVAEMVVEPSGCVEWLMGYALFFAGDWKSAQQQFQLGYRKDKRLPTWFIGLRRMLVARLESDQEMASQFTCAKFFTQPEEASGV